MQRSRNARNLVESIKEIKCFLHERHRLLRQEKQMVEEEDNKLLKDYVIPTDEEPQYDIVHPP